MTAATITNTEPVFPARGRALRPPSPERSAHTEMPRLAGSSFLPNQPNITALEADPAPLSGGRPLDAAGASTSLPDPGLLERLRLQQRLVELDRIAKDELGLAGLSESVVQQTMNLVSSLGQFNDDKLHDLLAETFVSVIYDGELQMEWEWDESYAEVEIRSDGRYRVLIKDATGVCTNETRSDTAAAVAILAARAS